MGNTAKVSNERVETFLFRLFRFFQLTRCVCQSMFVTLWFEDRCYQMKKKHNNNQKTTTNKREMASERRAVWSATSPVRATGGGSLDKWTTTDSFLISEIA